MTAPAIIDLTYSGESLQDLANGIFFEIVSGLYDGLEVRGKDVIVPYSVGQEPRARRRDHRLITLAGIVQGVGDTEDERSITYGATRAALEESGGLLALDRMPADLVATFSDGSTRTIAARPQAHVPVVRVPEQFAELTVVLLSVVPDWTYAAPP